MKSKVRILNQPTNKSDLRLDELDDTFSDDLELKIERFMARKRSLQDF